MEGARRSILDEVVERETEERVADAIARLPEREKLVIALRQNEGLSMDEIASVLGVGIADVDRIRADALRALAGLLALEREGGRPQPVILGPDGVPLTEGSAARRELELSIVEIGEDFIALLADQPELLYKLSPRRFEELVAELYQRRGFEATLTPRSNDAGVDVFVVRHDELGTSLSVIQCKRYAPNRKVGPGLVRELQGTIAGASASAGVLLTTSFFTRGARRLERRFRYQLSLQDYFAVQELLRLPGKISVLQFGN